MVMTKYFNENDPVFCYDYTNGNIVKCFGTIHRNTEYPHVSDWYIKYDDGEEFAVLDMEMVFKAPKSATLTDNLSKQLNNTGKEHEV